LECGGWTPPWDLGAETGRRTGAFVFHGAKAASSRHTPRRFAQKLFGGAARLVLCMTRFTGARVIFDEWPAGRLGGLRRVFLEKAYYTKNKWLTSPVGPTIGGLEGAQPGCACDRANPRTIGRLCVVGRAEGALECGSASYRLCLATNGEQGGSFAAALQGTSREE